MGARVQCPRCKGAKGTTGGWWQVDCGVCKGKGWIELPVDQIVDTLRPHVEKALKPYLDKGVSLLMKALRSLR